MWCDDLSKVFNAVVNDGELSPSQKDGHYTSSI